MYAIVRSGGKQHRVAVGDVFTTEKVVAAPGESVTLPTLLLVVGGSVTHDAAALAATPVTAEVVDHGKGPKISMILYKNKTGYRRRIGHRQPLTRLLVTAIGDVTALAEPAESAKADSDTNDRVASDEATEA